MTLTLELSPAEEARLAAAAAQNGLEPAALAKKLVTEHLPALQNGASAAVQEQERIARILAAEGSFSHFTASVDDLHRERQADKAKEEAWIKEYMP